MSLRDEMISGYLQLALDVEKPVAEQVTAVLESYGALSITITSVNNQASFDVAQPGEPQWELQRLSSLFEPTQKQQPIIDALNQYLGSEQAVEISRVADQDWERAWLENFKPFMAGKRLWVCPSWCDPVVKDTINLVIDPGMAFGTGTHETTRLCLEYLSRAQLTEKTVIDFGCGSGILGIAACKLGVGNAIGLDVDPRAVKAAIENAKINQVAADFQVMVNDQLFGSDHYFQADLVIANILAKTLIEYSHNIQSMVIKGGQLLLSGLLESQVDEVIRAYDNRFEFNIEQLNDWVLLVGNAKPEFEK